MKRIIEIEIGCCGDCPLNYRDGDDILEKQSKGGEWIPCSEKMPEELVAVNITWVNRNPHSYYIHIKDKTFTGTGIFYRGKWCWESPLTKDVLKEYGEYSDCLVDKDIDITAWMPLPESYYEGREQ